MPYPEERFTEVVDFYLPPEGSSYRLAVVTIKDSTPDTRSAS